MPCLHLSQLSTADMTKLHKTMYCRDIHAYLGKGEVIHVESLELDYSQYQLAPLWLLDLLVWNVAQEREQQEVKDTWPMWKC